MADILRIGNCSGFYGDRLSAMREMLEGGDLDVLSGDYLAELTMLILGRDRLKDPTTGYARTFVRQVEDCLGLALERGVRLVANAGGLNPSGLADRVREVAAGLGLAPVVAHLEGDDLLGRVEPLGLVDPRLGKPLTANAYLGAFGIAAALDAGADVVVTGRVTDASLVVGPAIARHGWTRTSYDELAGATVAGHVIECGTQATGGNFSGFLADGLAEDHRPLGFPVAEVAADGSSVITKHVGTGGLVSVDTVTAQLTYEIGRPAYLGPDVTTHLDTVALTDQGPDRVRITGVRGSEPPETLKVCLNFLGGYRNSVELLLTGLDVEAKSRWLRDQLETSWAGRRPQTVEWSTSAPPVADPASQDVAFSLLRCTVLDPSPEVAGRGLTGPAVELALASYPGFTLSAPPGPASPYGIYRPGYVDRAAVAPVVVLPDRSLPVDPAPARGGERHVAQEVTAHPTAYDGPTHRLPLGHVAHARSGDKGGDANIGVWARDRRDDRAAWLQQLLTPAKVHELLPDTAGLEVDVHPLPNLRAVNIVVHGLLGQGVAASTRFDPQAKALGEWLRSRYVDVPEVLL